MLTQTAAHDDTSYNVVIQNVISLKTSLKYLNSYFLVKDLNIDYSTENENNDNNAWIISSSC
jgi:hypothetical protein